MHGLNMWSEWICVYLRSWKSIIAYNVFSILKINKTSDLSLYCLRFNGKKIAYYLGTQSRSSICVSNFIKVRLFDKAVAWLSIKHGPLNKDSLKITYFINFYFANNVSPSFISQTCYSISSLFYKCSIFAVVFIENSCFWQVIHLCSVIRVA